MVDVTPEMEQAYASWEIPTEVPPQSVPRWLGLLRAAFFAGWMARQRDAEAALLQECLSLREELSELACKYSWATDPFNSGFSGYEGVLVGQHQRKMWKEAGNRCATKADAAADLANQQESNS